MNNFLEQTNLPNELKEKLSNSSIVVNINKELKTIDIEFKNIPFLNPVENMMFYREINEIVIKKMNLSISSLNINSKFNEDNIYVYENIREFISEKINWFNLSKIFVKTNDENILIFVSIPDQKKYIEKIKVDLENYLKSFSVSEKSIIIKYQHLIFSEEKLSKVLDEKTNKSLNRKFEPEIFDEKVKKKFKKIDLKLLNKPQKKIYFEGKVFGYETNDTKNSTRIHNFNLGHSDIAFKITLIDKKLQNISINNGDILRVYGNYELNEYSNSFIIVAFNPKEDIQKISIESYNDISTGKKFLPRHEFHVHTKMSTLDGVSTVNEYVEQAEKYNIKSITITDHNTAQAYPEAYYASKGTEVKINYGVEFDVYDDVHTEVVINNRSQELLNSEYVIFDLETTSVSAWLGEIIEFGGVKWKNNEIVEKKQMFIKPNAPISEFTTSLTSITNADVKNAPELKESLIKIKEWIGDSILVAHNASFDFNFLNNAFINNGLGPLKNPTIDTMKLSWFFWPSSRSHRLGILAKNEQVKYDSEVAHRADYDAEVLSKVFERLIHKLLEKDIRDLIEINNKNLNEKGDGNFKIENYYFTSHITVVSKNQSGLRDINELVSMANVQNFNNKKKMPMLPLSLFLNEDESLLKNILVGSSCSNGFLFNAIMDGKWEQAKEIIRIYDYIEIFPPSSYNHLIFNNTIDKVQLKMILVKLKELADIEKIPVIVSSNAHYASKSEKAIRNILISAKRVGGLGHPLYNYRNPNIEKPNNHLRNSEEIFSEFEGYFDNEIIEQIAIKNPKIIQSMISDQKPIKDKLFAPKIPKAEENLKESINNKILELYGEKPNEIITKRIKRELSPIIEHGFAIIYYLSAVAVKKSNDDGYLVGSRGSVGSSLAATFAGITEVNPLDPHYRCPKCKHHEFDNSVDDGFDLPNKNCPVCETKMIGDGHKIPFETFLGFNADKVPDIDLNFSRDNQSDIHLFMKDFLGEDNVFRAGTISTAALKTAIGYVKNYEEISGNNFNSATVEWLASKIEGSKRTTGQHPGGLIVIPNEMSVYDFTPINYPGDDPKADWKTTHFDFHSIHDNLLKLDLLGHLDPSSVRMLQTLTGVDPKEIPMNDKEVISLFESNKALKFTENYTDEKLGILGIPEFGTSFVRELVRESKPKSFADLVRVSGLSHGTDVWTGNAQKLIKDGVATLSEVISVRDDIMTYLIDQGMDKAISFDIMESVRKGKGLTREWEHSMRDNRIPEWYIESCKLIKYMFPKAHATAYVMMAFRIAWYKINYPLEYYATYFSKRDVEIDLSKTIKGIDEMKKHFAEISSIPRKDKTKKDFDLLETYLIIFEMYSRGIEFSNVNIHLSRSMNYEIDRDNNKIIPPFSVVEGVGDIIAKSVTKNRKLKRFSSVSDFKLRSGLAKKAIQVLEDLGVFKNEIKGDEVTQQLSLFE